jgi:hypothetical protein
MERRWKQLSHKQLPTLYPPFLYVLAVYFYAMATFNLQIVLLGYTVYV